MILAEYAADCCGCGACMSVCPAGAITMVPDCHGAVYPRIDQAKCIACGLCQKTCHYQMPETDRKNQSAYAAFAAEPERLRHSASGGVFGALAASCLAAGGCAAGVVMDWTEDGVKVYHLLSDAPEDILRMQGSKYVHSEAWHCFLPIKEALKAGKRVLFSGTPCQCAAVQAITGNPENLVTVDLICHGVPPQKLLQEFCGVLERRFHGKLKNLCFRDKSVPKNFCARLDLERDGKRRSIFLRSRFLSFYDSFLKGTFYRENCYSCPYASLERAADLTIGDYWGIETVHGAQFEAGIMPRRRDWSCLLVNTEKGWDFLQCHGGCLQVYPSAPEQAAQGNAQLKGPSPKPKDREQLLKRYVQGGYAALEEEFIRSSGGKLRYFWRLMKNLRENQVLRKKNGYEN